jgi:putative acetyltransferase
MSYLIRRATHADAADIIRAHVRSIREICASDYSPEQIEAWAGRDFKVERWHTTMDRDLVWVVEVDQAVRGFGHLAFGAEKVATIVGLYFAPEAKGLGAGRRLFELMLKECRDRQVERLTLQATITAKPFYEKMGFESVEGSCSIKMQGVAVSCWPMERKLSL